MKAAVSVLSPIADTNISLPPSGRSTCQGQLYFCYVAPHTPRRSEGFALDSQFPAPEVTRSLVDPEFAGIEGLAALHIVNITRILYQAWHSVVLAGKVQRYLIMATMHRSGAFKRSRDGARLIITAMIGIIFGFFIGVSFPFVSLSKIRLTTSIVSSLDLLNDDGVSFRSKSIETLKAGEIPKIHVPTNPRGAESLPPDIVVAETDLYLRRLWGEPSEDLKKKPKYLVTFTVGFDQRNNINAAVKKFSDDFAIVLFHYDGRASEWDQFEWSKTAIHVSVKRQTKWWYAKRFLHPDVVAAYEYIFIWDEDLGVEHFNADKYIQLVKKHGLEISQPGLEPNNGLTWQMTKRRGDREVHKDTEEKPGWCSNPHLPPCAAFVEIMAPVFSSEAWRCVWHMIQNDLVHGWGLDFALRRCVEPAHEKIGVVDSQWIVHQVIPSLGSQGQSENGKAPWEGVRSRCRNEWSLFQNRLKNADKAYLALVGKR